MDNIIDGLALARKIMEKSKQDVASLPKKPGLATILVGNNPASELYINKKNEACMEIGINHRDIRLPTTSTERDIKRKIDELNNNPDIDAILLQLPLPKGLDTGSILENISPRKDVDCLTSVNLGRLVVGIETAASCTAKGIIRMLDESGVNLKGKNVVIINHSILLGRPLSIMMLNRNATVTLCHEFTQNLSEYTKWADVLITGTGVPKLLKADMIKQGAIVIDAGISKPDGKVVGDVDFDKVKEKVLLITPVPGGVGSMAVAILLENLITLAKKRNC